jgi:predicted ATPase
MTGACRAFAAALYYSGDFETTRQYAMRGLQIWRSRSIESPVQELIAPAPECLAYEALSEWHLGEIASCKTNMAEAIALAKELNDMAALGLALYWAGLLAHFEGNPAEVERLASDLIELSMRQGFASWLPGGVVLRGWARSASGNTAEGVSWIQDGIRDYQATGAALRLPYFLSLLEAIKEAEVVAERSEGRWWCAEMHRLRGVFLGTLGADEAQIEASFCAAIRTAKEQKSVSLEKRAEGTCAEYRRQKASPTRGRKFRLPLL